MSSMLWLQINMLTKCGIGPWPAYVNRIALRFQFPTWPRSWVLPILWHLVTGSTKRNQMDQRSVHHGWKRTVHALLRITAERLSSTQRSVDVFNFHQDLQNNSTGMFFCLFLPVRFHCYWIDYICYRLLPPAFTCQNLRTQSPMETQTWPSMISWLAHPSSRRVLHFWRLSFKRILYRTVYR